MCACVCVLIFYSNAKPLQNIVLRIHDQQSCTSLSFIVRIYRHYEDLLADLNFKGMVLGFRSEFGLGLGKGLGFGIQLRWLKLQ